ncbi:hypothetical protein BDZ85DRAFT_67446 [Elsinoe ampelina]|uniref:Ricin B lectin domain-containing protein n=1 Tax=Elsinoe ampelina TaxID=302913 RepID=A0A6A6GIF6_9PEZI|nr:hypothetical protein BDZ85DRAFT_67446 [Elsinoe ampelina]
MKALHSYLLVALPVVFSPINADIFAAHGQTLTNGTSDRPLKPGVARNPLEDTPEDAPGPELGNGTPSIRVMPVIRRWQPPVPTGPPAARFENDPTTIFPPAVRTALDAKFATLVSNTQIVDIFPQLSGSPPELQAVVLFLLGAPDELALRTAAFAQKQSGASIERLIEEAQVMGKDISIVLWDLFAVSQDSLGSADLTEITVDAAHNMMTILGQKPYTIGTCDVESQECRVNGHSQQGGQNSDTVQCSGEGHCCKVDGDRCGTVPHPNHDQSITICHSPRRELHGLVNGRGIWQGPWLNHVSTSPNRQSTSNLTCSAMVVNRLTACNSQKFWYDHCRTRFASQADSAHGRPPKAQLAPHHELHTRHHKPDKDEHDRKKHHKDHGDPYEKACIAYASANTQKCMGRAIEWENICTSTWRIFEGIEKADLSNSTHTPMPRPYHGFQPRKNSSTPITSAKGNDSAVEWSALRLPDLPDRPAKKFCQTSKFELEQGRCKKIPFERKHFNAACKAEVEFWYWMCETRFTLGQDAAAGETKACEATEQVDAVKCRDRSGEHGHERHLCEFMVRAARHKCEALIEDRSRVLPNNGTIPESPASNITMPTWPNDNTKKACEARRCRIEDQQCHHKHLTHHWKHYCINLTNAWFHGCRAAFYGKIDTNSLSMAGLPSATPYEDSPATATSTDEGSEPTAAPTGTFPLTETSTPATVTWA